MGIWDIWGNKAELCVDFELINILLHKRKIAFKINSKIEVELKESQYWYHKELSFMNHEQSKAYPQVFRG